MACIIKVYKIINEINEINYKIQIMNTILQTLIMNAAKNKKKIVFVCLFVWEFGDYFLVLII